MSRRVEDRNAATMIEFPSMGATYYTEEFGVYRYDEYPSYSVLAGQTRRTFLGSYDTLEEAQAAHPTAEVASGSCYVPVSLNHLPDDDGGWDEPMTEEDY